MNSKFLFNKKIWSIKPQRLCYERTTTLAYAIQHTRTEKKIILDIQLPYSVKVANKLKGQSFKQGIYNNPAKKKPPHFAGNLS